MLGEVFPKQHSLDQARRMQWFRVIGLQQKSSFWFHALAGANLLFSHYLSQTPNSQSFFSLFPGLGTAEFPPWHHHTFGEVFFPTCSAQGGCLVRMPWSLPGARSCAGTSPSTLPTTPVGQTNSPGTHPCRTGSSARLKGQQGNFGGEFKLCCKEEDRPERFLLRRGRAQRRRLELMDSAITEMLGEAQGRLLFLRPARAEPSPSPSPRHSSRKHCSPEPFESFRLHREPTALMSLGCQHHAL